MYYLLIGILYPLSLLPLRVLYLLSDLMYVLVYHVAGYRRAVVADNLMHAFPEKSDAERKAIKKRFYRSFCDQWVELIKLISISERQLQRRVTGNWQLIKDLYADDRDIYMMLGHTFNWEWVNVAVQYNSPHQVAGVYMPTKNPAMDRLINYARSRGGGWLISMKAKKGFQRLQGTRHIVGLIADQNPSNMNGALWLPFMHREAPFFKGPEQLATRAKAAVVFCGIRKVKRGHYAVDMQLLTKDASTMASGEVIKSYVTFMEQQLNDQPENWLWTHKRWKHSKEIQNAKAQSPKEPAN